MPQEVQGIEEQVSTKQQRKQGRPLKEEFEKIDIEIKRSWGPRKKQIPQLEPLLDLCQEDQEDHEEDVV